MSFSIVKIPYTTPCCTHQEWARAQWKFIYAKEISVHECICLFWKNRTYHWKRWISVMLDENSEKLLTHMHWLNRKNNYTPTEKSCCGVCGAVLVLFFHRDDIASQYIKNLYSTNFSRFKRAVYGYINSVQFMKTFHRMFNYWEFVFLYFFFSSEFRLPSVVSFCTWKIFLCSDG